MKCSVLIPLLLGGCSLIFSGYSTHAVSPEDKNDIELVIKTDRNAYLKGDQVKIIMTVKNISMNSVTLEFTTSRHYDFMILKDDQDVWMWSRDKYFAQAFTTIVIKPGESLTYTVEWNQRDNMGNDVTPGRYRIMGTLPAIGRELSASVSIPISK